MAITTDTAENKEIDMEEDIYDDINNIDLGNDLYQAKLTNTALMKHIDSLNEDVVKLTKALTNMKSVNDNLATNISSLYNTAKNEIERKDRQIAEMQKRLDEMIFRRERKNEKSIKLDNNFSQYNDQDRKYEKIQKEDDWYEYQNYAGGFNTNKGHDGSMENPYGVSDKNVARSQNLYKVLNDSDQEERPSVRLKHSGNGKKSAEASSPQKKKLKVVNKVERDYKRKLSSGGSTQFSENDRNRGKIDRYGESDEKSQEREKTDRRDTNGKSTNKFATGRKSFDMTTIESSRNRTDNRPEPSANLHFNFDNEKHKHSIDTSIANKSHANDKNNDRRCDIDCVELEDGEILDDFENYQRDRRQRGMHRQRHEFKARIYNDYKKDPYNHVSQRRNRSKSSCDFGKIVGEEIHKLNEECHRRKNNIPNDRDREKAKSKWMRDSNKKPADHKCIEDNSLKKDESRTQDERENIGKCNSVSNRRDEKKGEFDRRSTNDDRRANVEEFKQRENEESEGICKKYNSVLDSKNDKKEESDKAQTTSDEKIKKSNNSISNHRDVKEGEFDNGSKKDKTPLNIQEYIKRHQKISSAKETEKNSDSVSNHRDDKEEFSARSTSSDVKSIKLEEEFERQRNLVSNHRDEKEGGETDQSCIRDKTVGNTEESSKSQRLSFEKISNSGETVNKFDSVSNDFVENKEEFDRRTTEEKNQIKMEESTKKKEIPSDEQTEESEKSSQGKKSQSIDRDSDSDRIQSKETLERKISIARVEKKEKHRGKDLPLIEESTSKLKCENMALIKSSEEMSSVDSIKSILQAEAIINGKSVDKSNKEFCIESRENVDSCQKSNDHGIKENKRSKKNTVSRIKEAHLADKVDNSNERNDQISAEDLSSAESIENNIVTTTIGVKKADVAFEGSNKKVEDTQEIKKSKTKSANESKEMSDAKLHKKINDHKIEKVKSSKRKPESRKNDTHLDDKSKETLKTSKLSKDGGDRGVKHHEATKDLPLVETISALKKCDSSPTSKSVDGMNSLESTIKGIVHDTTKEAIDRKSTIRKEADVLLVKNSDKRDDDTHEIKKKRSRTKSCNDGMTEKDANIHRIKEDKSLKKKAESRKKETHLDNKIEKSKETRKRSKSSSMDRNDEKRRKLNETSKDLPVIETISTKKKSENLPSSKTSEVLLGTAKNMETIDGKLASKKQALIDLFGNSDNELDGNDVKSNNDKLIKEDKCSKKNHSDKKTSNETRKRSKSSSIDRNEKEGRKLNNNNLKSKSEILDPVKSTEELSSVNSIKNILHGCIVNEDATVDNLSKNENDHKNGKNKSSKKKEESRKKDNVSECTSPKRKCEQQITVEKVIRKFDVEEQPDAKSLHRISTDRIIVLSDIKLTPSKHVAHDQNKDSNMECVTEPKQQSILDSSPRSSHNKKTGKSIVQKTADDLDEIKMHLESSNDEEIPLIKSEGINVRRSTRERKEVQRLDVSVASRCTTRRKSRDCSKFKKDDEDIIKEEEEMEDKIVALEGRIERDPAEIGLQRRQTDRDPGQFDKDSSKVMEDKLANKAVKLENKIETDAIGSITSKIPSVDDNIIDNHNNNSSLPLDSTVSTQTISQIQLELGGLKTPNTNTSSKERRRITPIPVKDKKAVVANSSNIFENILVKNNYQPTTFTVQNTFHLTHEGEIPQLHIEENHLNNLSIDDGCKNAADNSLIKLLDTMDMVDGELTKFKSSTSTNNSDGYCINNQVEHNNSDVEAAGNVHNINQQLTFENCIKVTSTPISNNVATTDSCKNVCNLLKKHCDDIAPLNTEQNSIATTITTNTSTAITTVPNNVNNRPVRRKRVKVLRVVLLD